MFPVWNGCYCFPLLTAFYEVGLELISPAELARLGLLVPYLTGVGPRYFYPWLLLCDYICTIGPSTLFMAFFVAGFCKGGCAVNVFTFAVLPATYRLWFFYMTLWLWGIS